ncbi:glycosyltransferase family 4 protein [Synechococcus sp. HK01-R]|nr:glycosyltransferase family 4 protein [Synechococcus sp. HK01-R]
MVTAPPGHTVILQLLREWPPGYGGVERVAHELASVWGGTVYSFDAQGLAQRQQDALPVTYRRQRLACTVPLGRLRLPLPSRALWRLLRDPQPLHGHLPSPGVLLVLLLARLLRRRRRVTAHWHSFLDPDPSLNGVLFELYQRLALWGLPLLSAVVTTSPLLAQELVRCGCRPERVQVLPCCLSAAQEALALALPPRTPRQGDPLRLIFIGRLDSYKRLDWLLEALATLQTPWQLAVVGDGPQRLALEALSQALVAASAWGCVRFHGRLPEAAKQRELAAAEVLVLPSDRCHEAFGIVQLEAMAAGIPALAFQLPRSGMGWVGQLPDLDWPQTPEALPAVLQRLAASPGLRARLSVQARERYQRLFARCIWEPQLQRLYPAADATG